MKNPILYLLYTSFYQLNETIFNNWLIVVLGVLFLGMLRLKVQADLVGLGY